MKPIISPLKYLRLVIIALISRRNRASIVIALLYLYVFRNIRICVTHKNAMRIKYRTINNEYSN